MTTVEARLAEVNGKRAVVLSFTLNQSDHQPRRVVLIEEHRLVDAVLLPFEWRFLNETAEGTPPQVTVVAAPGVSIRLDGFPAAYTPAPGLPGVNVYRVQDPSLLPRPATDPAAMNLVGSSEVAPDSALSNLIEYADADAEGHGYRIVWDPSKYFKVDRLPDGVEILYLARGDRWTLTVPQISGDNQGRDATTRFAFEIDVEQGAAGDPDHPLLKIVKTPNVTLKLVEPRLIQTFFGMRTTPSPTQPPYWQVWEVDDVDAVPPQGAPIEPGDDWRVVNVRSTMSAEYQAVVTEQQIVFDLTVGLVPAAGDCIDVAEFALGLFTGQDKWGRPLDAADLAIMGLAALLPFVTSPMLRRGKTFLRRFGQRAEVADGLIGRIGKARQAGLLTQADEELLRAMDAEIRAGRLPGKAAWAEARRILAGIPGGELTFETLLNVRRDGFVHAELQENYQRYVATKKLSKGKVADPVEWARSTQKNPRRLLVSLLGKDYTAALGAAPPKNLLGIARPADLTDEALALYCQQALSDPERLTDRLSKLFDAPADPGAAGLGLVRQQVSEGHFRIFKGNLAEVFSMGLQLETLKKFTADRRFRDARLVSGVRIRLKQNGGLSNRLLFSDNLIVTGSERRLQVLAVFEVKSGFKGGEEAQEQIFEWIERRLTDGSELVLPQGARVITEDGVKRTTRDVTYTWNPTSEDVPRVTGLASGAERYLITAAGASYLGIDSGFNVASRVTWLPLPENSALLDYLAAYLLARMEKGTGAAAAPRVLLPGVGGR